MHELLLFGQIPRARHDQVLKVLAGVSAMQPRRMLERIVLYKPQRLPEEPGSQLRRGGSQAVSEKNKNKKAAATRDLYFTQLHQHLAEEDFAPKDDSSQEQESNALVAGRGAPWSLHFYDVPEAQDRDGVLVRKTQSTDILEGNPHEYMLDCGNQFVTEYYNEGHRFVHDNIVITLYRYLQEPGTRSLLTEPKAALPAFDALQPLDGSYLLEAKIRVAEMEKAVVVKAGTDELNAFKASMKGCVELFAPERLALDTRVKYKPGQTMAR